MTEELEQAFEAMHWHDSVLLSLNVDRGNPGNRDDVVLMVAWPDGRKQKVCFADCYALEATMNFGVIAPESICAARCIAASPKLAEMRRRWAALGVDLKSLRCFALTTNSTAGEICIYAMRYQVADS